jgi:hypothetical protein
MPLPPMVSYFHKPLMLSLEVPNTWARAKMPDTELALFGPEVDNYRINLAFNIHQINPNMPGSFDNLIKASYFSGNMERSLEQFHLAESAKFTLDGHEAFQALMQWVGEEGGTKLALTQLDLLIQTAPDTVYEIHGYTLRQHEVANIPILEHILGSIRIIPQKPAPAEEPYHFNINPN